MRIARYRNHNLIFFICLNLVILAKEAHSQTIPDTSKMLEWIRTNVSPKTQMFYSFQVLPQDRKDVYSQMGESQSSDGIIERTIVDKGLVVYDGAVGQIALSQLGFEEDLSLAERPIDAYWQGSLENLHNIRARASQNQFIYNVKKGTSPLNGFIFRIINADGQYTLSDPLDGKTQSSSFPEFPAIHWLDWKPIAGENAWVTMAALHIYHKKYFDPYLNHYAHNFQAKEILLAEEIAQAAILLQAENGGVRMAPIGTYQFPEMAQDIPEGYWWYYQISTENNISWYAAFRMLYEITGNRKYLTAQKGIEKYLKTVFNKEEGYFYQGMNYNQEKWQFNDAYFALDVQTWAIDCLGPQRIDQLFGDGAAFQIWQQAKDLSGVRNEGKELIGVGYTTENDRISVEWSAGAIMAAQILGQYYEEAHPDWSLEALSDAKTMRHGMELLRKDINESQTAYAYSSKRGWIPFGWYSHQPQVLSLASTGWIAFVDKKFNPFYLKGAPD